MTSSDHARPSASAFPRPSYPSLSLYPFFSPFPVLVLCRRHFPLVASHHRFFASLLPSSDNQELNSILTVVTEHNVSTNQLLRRSCTARSLYVSGQPWCTGQFFCCWRQATLEPRCACHDTCWLLFYERPSKCRATFFFNRDQINY